MNHKHSFYQAEGLESVIRGVIRWQESLNVASKAEKPVEDIKHTPVSGDALKVRGWKDCR